MTMPAHGMASGAGATADPEGSAAAYTQAAYDAGLAAASQDARQAEAEALIGEVVAFAVGCLLTGPRMRAMVDHGVRLFDAASWLPSPEDEARAWLFEWDPWAEDPVARRQWERWFIGGGPRPFHPDAGRWVLKPPSKTNHWRLPYNTRVEFTYSTPPVYR